MTLKVVGVNSNVEVPVLVIIKCQKAEIWNTSWFVLAYVCRLFEIGLKQTGRNLWEAV